VVKVFVTDKGTELLGRLDDEAQVFLKQALGELGAKRLKQLRDLLNEARSGFRPYPVPQANGK
jgi:DNA-binding MarR family transcriptional regulator